MVLSACICQMRRPQGGYFIRPGESIYIFKAGAGKVKYLRLKNSLLMMVITIRFIHCLGSYVMVLPLSL